MLDINNKSEAFINGPATIKSIEIEFSIKTASLVISPSDVCAAEITPPTVHILQKKWFTALHTSMPLHNYLMIRCQC